MAFWRNTRTIDSGSSTMGTSFLPPMTPPLALISSIAISSALCSDRSMIAMVPLKEWRMPTLTSSLSSALANFCV